MKKRNMAMLTAAGFLAIQCVAGPARADNPMGYQLLSPQASASLPRNGGSLGMDIERSQQITDDGMTFDVIRVRNVRRGSPGAQAGFSPGDQIIAVDGRVFPSLGTFAAYIGSVPPGTTVTVDYIPANGGPAQAQRVPVMVGAAGGAVAPQAPAATGMSTTAKVAIGVGAAALLGCYEMGCFSHRRPAQGSPGRQPPYPPAGAMQPQNGVQRQ